MIGFLPAAAHFGFWSSANTISREPRVVPTVSPHKSSSPSTLTVLSASAANASLASSVPTWSITFSRASEMPICPVAPSNRLDCSPGISVSKVVGLMSSVSPSACVAARMMSISHPATSPLASRKSSGGEPSATARVKTLLAAMSGGSSFTRSGCGDWVGIASCARPGAMLSRQAKLVASARRIGALISVPMVQLRWRWLPCDGRARPRLPRIVPSP